MRRETWMGSDQLDDASSAEIAATQGPLDYEAAVIRAIQRRVGRSVIVVRGGGPPFGLPDAREFSPQSRTALMDEIERSMGRLRQGGNDADSQEEKAFEVASFTDPSRVSSESAIEAALNSGLISDEDADHVRGALGISLV